MVKLTFEKVIRFNQNKKLFIILKLLAFLLCVIYYKINMFHLFYEKEFIFDAKLMKLKQYDVWWKSCYVICCLIFCAW